MTEAPDGVVASGPPRSLLPSLVRVPQPVFGIDSTSDHHAIEGSRIRRLFGLVQVDIQTSILEYTGDPLGDSSSGTVLGREDNEETHRSEIDLRRR